MTAAERVAVRPWCAPGVADAAAAATRWLVIDTETEGLDPSRHRLLEFAAVLVRRGEQRLVGAASLDLGDALQAAAVELAAPGTVLVAHNLGFDLSFLSAHSDVPAILARPPAWLCTLLAGDRPRTLDALAAMSGVPVSGRHTAEGDARVLAGVVFSLMDAATPGATVAQALAPITGGAVADLGAPDAGSTLAGLRESLDHVVPSHFPTRAAREAVAVVVERARASSVLPTDHDQLVGILRENRITVAIFDQLMAEIIDPDT